MFKFSRKKKNKGFTLVELIVVIAILAILVGLLAPQYTKYVEKSRKSADVSNLENLVTGLKVAAADHEYQLSGNTAGENTVYKIEINDRKTILTVPKVADAAENATATYDTYAAQALNAYAGTTFETDGTKRILEDGSVTLKSSKWGKPDGASGTTAIMATITINNDTDAVTVVYSNNVKQYSQNGKLD